MKGRKMILYLLSDESSKPVEDGFEDSTLNPSSAGLEDEDSILNYINFPTILSGFRGFKFTGSFSVRLTVRVHPCSLREALELAQGESALVGIEPEISRNSSHKESSFALSYPIGLRKSIVAITMGEE
nr:hypothetical protein Itr_chr10CG11330 [Ipomoea trifida]